MSIVLYILITIYLIIAGIVFGLSASMLGLFIVFSPHKTSYPKELFYCFLGALVWPIMLIVLWVRK